MVQFCDFCTLHAKSGVTVTAVQQIQDLKCRSRCIELGTVQTASVESLRIEILFVLLRNALRYRRAIVTHTRRHRRRRQGEKIFFQTFRRLAVWIRSLVRHDVLCGKTREKFSKTQRTDKEADLWRETDTTSQSSAKNKINKRKRNELSECNYKPWKSCSNDKKFN